MIELRYRITGVLNTSTVCIILIAALLLSGCRSEEPAPPPPLPAETSASVSIHMKRPTATPAPADTSSTTGSETVTDNRATTDAFWGMVTEAVAD